MSESVNDRYEQVAEELGVSFDFYKHVDDILLSEGDGALRRFLSLPLSKTRVVVCCAIVRRLKAMLKAMYGGPFVSVRWDGDEWLYQCLYAPLMKNLQGDGLQSALAKASAILPESLPDGEEAPELWEYGLKTGLNALEAELMRRCVAEVVDPYHHGAGADVFFVAQDDAIKKLQAESKRLNKHFHEKLMRPASVAEPTNRAPRGKPAGRIGRPTVDIDPGVVAKTYWSMRDEYLDEGESRDPTQKEVCERLTELGHRLSEKTMRRILRAAGILEWPPPRPEEAA